MNILKWMCKKNFGVNLTLKAECPFCHKKVNDLEEHDIDCEVTSDA